MVPAANDSLPHRYWSLWRYSDFLGWSAWLKEKLSHFGFNTCKSIIYNYAFRRVASGALTALMKFFGMSATPQRSRKDKWQRTILQQCTRCCLSTQSWSTRWKRSQRLKNSKPLRHYPKITAVIRQRLDIGWWRLVSPGSRKCCDSSVNAAYTMNGCSVRRQTKGHFSVGVACAPQLAILSCYLIEKKYALETNPDF